MAKAALSRYRQMRDFSKTAEPSGSEAGVAPSNRLRYVIQKHAATRLHYDFRLELDGVFKSWAVTKGPSLDPHDRRPVGCRPGYHGRRSNPEKSGRQQQDHGVLS